jgi:rubrerythrin
MSTTFKTEGNLRTAFAGESQANRRYLFFADRAEKEGYPQVAKLFRAVAEAETVHARNHFSTMDGVGTTKENLLAAIMGEHYEFTQMYPPFVAEAEAENNKRARISFDHANQVEKIHHALYEAALKKVNDGQQPKAEPYFVCQVCGNTVAGEPPDVCPICQSPREQFKRVD